VTPKPEELLGYDAISELTGVSVKTLRAWKARGKLPTPDYVVLTGNPVPAWKSITIAKWNTARLQAGTKEADNGTDGV
jgi:hypothetical protein